MGCNRCEKKNANYRKGLWSPDEDQRLRDYVLEYGHGRWSSVPVNAGLQRNGKSCRLRWINYLRPGLKHGMFSREEEETVINLHAVMGNKWSQIAMYLPGRTDNEVKNYWNSYLKKRVNPAQASSSESPDIANQVVETMQFPCDPSNQMLDKFMEPQPSTIFSKVMFADWLYDEQWDSNLQTNIGFQPIQSNGEFHGFEAGSIHGEFQSEFQAFDHLITDDMNLW